MTFCTNGDPGSFCRMVLDSIPGGVVVVTVIYAIAFLGLMGWVGFENWREKRKRRGHKTCLGPAGYQKGDYHYREKK